MQTRNFTFIEKCALAQNQCVLRENIIDSRRKRFQLTVQTFLNPFRTMINGRSGAENGISSQQKSTPPVTFWMPIKKTIQWMLLMLRNGKTVYGCIGAAGDVHLSNNRFERVSIIFFSPPFVCCISHITLQLPIAPS